MNMMNINVLSKLYQQINVMIHIFKYTLFNWFLFSAWLQWLIARLKLARKHKHLKKLHKRLWIQTKKRIYLYKGRFKIHTKSHNSRCILMNMKTFFNCQKQCLQMVSLFRNDKSRIVKYQWFYLFFWRNMADEIQISYESLYTLRPDIHFSIALHQQKFFSIQHVLKYSRRRFNSHHHIKIGRTTVLILIITYLFQVCKKVETCESFKERSFSKEKNQTPLKCIRVNVI